MATELRHSRRRLPPEARFLLMALPGVAFITAFLLVPILSIVVFSFWRTESYRLIPAWNLKNYTTLFTTSTYMTFLLRSVLTAIAVSLAALLYSWPIAYVMAKHGGRYRLLLSLAVAAPFFTGVILRISGIQGIMGPVGLINMALMNAGIAPIKALMDTPTAAAIGIAYLFIPFVVTAIYLSLLNFDFELLEVAKINGARSWRAFIEVTLPLISPAMLGAFVVSFILAFNNLEISFYTLGAIPTLPTIAWGSLRFGLGGELYALAALVNATVLLAFLVMFLLMRWRIVSFGHRET